MKPIAANAFAARVVVETHVATFLCGTPKRNRKAQRRDRGSACIGDLLAGAVRSVRQTMCEVRTSDPQVKPLAQPATETARRPYSL